MSYSKFEYVCVMSLHVSMCVIGISMVMWNISLDPFIHTILLCGVSHSRIDTARKELTDSALEHMKKNKIFTTIRIHSNSN